MSCDIELDYCRVSGPEDAFVKAKSTLEAIKNEGKIPVPISFVYDESLGKISGEGKGFKVYLEFYEKNALVYLDLSLMLRPMKSKIIAIIEKALKDHL